MLSRAGEWRLYWGVVCGPLGSTTVSPQLDGVFDFYLLPTSSQAKQAHPSDLTMLKEVFLLDLSMGHNVTDKG